MCLDKDKLVAAVENLSPPLKALINIATLRIVGRPLEQLLETTPREALKAFLQFAGPHNYQLLLRIFQQQLAKQRCYVTLEELERFIEK